MFWYGSFINPSAEKNAALCSTSFLQKNYDEGLEAFSELGECREVYRMQINSVGNSVYLNAYREYAAVYFNIYPEHVSDILFKNINRTCMNTNADLFHKRSYSLIQKLSYDLINAETGPEEYKQNSAKRLELGSKNLVRLFRHSNDNSLISGIEEYSERLIEEGNPVQGVRNLSKTLGNSSLYWRIGDEYKGPSHLPESFKRALLAASPEVNETGRDMLYREARRHRSVLNKMQSSGYNLTIEEMKPIDQRILNEQTIHVEEGLKQVKGLLKGQNVA